MFFISLFPILHASQQLHVQQSPYLLPASVSLKSVGVLRNTKEKIQVSYTPQLSALSEYHISTLPSPIPIWSNHSLNSKSFNTNNLHSNLLYKNYLVPDHNDPQTVLSLGLMAYNAYYDTHDKEWQDIPGWAPSDGFGSIHDAIRGYIFSSQKDSIVVVVIKGTSLVTPFTGGQVGVNDKLNDNMMFSCCCGKAGWSWTPVQNCGCSNSGATECQSQCILENSDYKESYYRLATTMFYTFYFSVDAAMQMFPRSNIWVSGFSFLIFRHSLGGSLASLVALTFDLPAFTYQTPGDLLFAKRIGLLPPSPPSIKKDMVSYDGGDSEDWDSYLNTLPIYQFGNDGDPIFLGTCLKSVRSSCWLGGYAIETKCHLGKECVYDIDLVSKKSKKWYTTTKSESVYNHGIQFVIDKFLKVWDHVPECKVNVLHEKCSDCEKWKFVE